ncbi:hypothetical protein [Streptomyces sp. GESEQ-35]|uniref:hypothetical protein n=1 Tax=Streptomyces sp. GESEQ-35 TaxID=2812657 RepID=UPI001B32C662|nr:hypothetical protein [Streptomyces sp. GESEQ-35]
MTSTTARISRACASGEETDGGPVHDEQYAEEAPRRGAGNCATSHNETRKRPTAHYGTPRSA